MRLENLYSNFGTASPEEQAAYMSAYRFRRAEDMAKPSTWPKTKKSSGKGSKIDLSLTDEEKALMKMLGLKQKDMLLLRTSTEEIEEEEDDSTLLNDNTFDGDE